MGNMEIDANSVSLLVDAAIQKSNELLNVILNGYKIFMRLSRARKTFSRLLKFFCPWKSKLVWEPMWL
jgi:hypothetical protein